MQTMLTSRPVYRGGPTEPWIIAPRIPADETYSIKWGEGRVKFFSEDKGFGFIERVGQPELFFHAKQAIAVDLDVEALRLNIMTHVPIDDPPVSGAKVLFEAGEHRGKITATKWMPWVDLSDLRRELNLFGDEEFNSIMAMPLYKLEAITVTLGPPKANNVKKCYEREEIESAPHVLFEGNNVNALRTILNEDRSKSSKYETKYRCFVHRTISKDYEPCEIPVV